MIKIPYRPGNIDIQRNNENKTYSYIIPGNGREFMMMEYIYLGDKLTDSGFKRMGCNAVRFENGKCIRGRNGNMLVRFESGQIVNVIAKLLRKIRSSK